MGSARRTWRWVELLRLSTLPDMRSLAPSNRFERSRDRRSSPLRRCEYGALLTSTVTAPVRAPERKSVSCFGLREHRECRFNTKGVISHNVDLKYARNPEDDAKQGFSRNDS